MLKQRLAAMEDAAHQQRIAYRLGTLQPGHPQATDCLLRLLLSQQSPALYKQIVENLKEVLLDDRLGEVVSRLKEWGLTVNWNMSVGATVENSSTQVNKCYKLLWHCARRMTYSSFFRAWSS